MVFTGPLPDAVRNRFELRRDAIYLWNDTGRRIEAEILWAIKWGGWQIALVWRSGAEGLREASAAARAASAAAAGAGPRHRARSSAAARCWPANRPGADCTTATATFAMESERKYSVGKLDASKGEVVARA